MLLLKLRPCVERAFVSYQAGFKRGKATSNQLFSLRVMLERTCEYNIWTLSHDSVIRKELYRVMPDMGIPPEQVNLTKMTMSSVRCHVRTDGECSSLLSFLYPLPYKNNITIEHLFVGTDGVTEAAESLEDKDDIEELLCCCINGSYCSAASLLL